MLFNHDTNIVFARTKAGTLTLSEDDTGLLTSATLPDTQAARDLAVSMERGDIDQMSFAFLADPDGSVWDTEPDGRWLRTIKRVADLYDVSPVTFPAYPDTSIALRGKPDAGNTAPPIDPRRDRLEAAKRAQKERLRREISDEIAAKQDRPDGRK